MKLNKNIKKYSFLIIIVVIIMIFFTHINRKKQIEEAVNQVTRYYNNENISRDNLINISNQMTNSKHLEEKHFIKGCINTIDDNIDEAIDDFTLALENAYKNKWNNNVKVYAASYLARLYKEKGNLGKSAEVIFTNFSILDIYTYNKYKNVIWNTMTEVTEYSSNKNINVNNLTKIQKINIIKCLKNYYEVSIDRLNIAKYVIKLIVLDKDLEVQYIKAKTQIDYGILLNSIGNTEKAKEAIAYGLSLPIDDKYENAYIQVDGNLKLAKIYILNGEFHKAKETINNIDYYINYFNKEDFRDVEIIANVIKGEIYLSDNEFSKAEQVYEYVKMLLMEDKEELYFQKKETVLLLRAQIYEAKNDYTAAIECYKEILDSEYTSESMILDNVALTRLEKIAAIIDDKQLQEQSREKSEKLITLYQSMILNEYSESYMNYIENEKVLNEKTNMIYNMYVIFIVQILVAITIIIIAYKVIKKIRKVTLFDSMTGIYNRGYFDKTYKELLKGNEKFAVVMSDIDNFKKINDTYGHSTGDIVLKRVCKIIDDFTNDDMGVFRYGGEEIVILIKYTDRRDVRKLAESIRFAVENVIWKENIQVTMSLGVAYSPDYKERTLGKADENLYKAKNSGKNKVVYM